MATYALMGNDISNAAGDGPPNFPFGLRQAGGVVIKDLLNSSYVITNSDAVEFVTSSTTLSVNQTVTLPSAVNNIGRLIKFKKSDASNFAIQVIIPGGDTLDGQSAAYSLSNLFSTITVYAYAPGKWSIMEAARIPQNVVRLTTLGSGTYTPSPYTSFIQVEMAGSGGGGGGGAIAASGNNGTAALGPTVFSIASGAAIVTCNGGGLGGGGSRQVSDPGGTVVIGAGSPKIILQLNGQRGCAAPYVPSGAFSIVGVGGVTPLGGGGGSTSGGAAIDSPIANTGAGGTGGNSTSGGANQGGYGGSAGGYCKFIMPAANYDWSIAGPGTGGTGGGGGGTGTSGSLGVIIITENFV